MIAGIEGSGSVAVKVGQLIPRQIDLEALTGRMIDFNGDWTEDPTAGAFGSLGGVAFYNLVTEANEPSTLTASGLEARPLLAVYEEAGGQLLLRQWQLPDASGTASVERALTLARLHGVAAIPLGFTGAPLTVTIDAPLQTGVGVGMVPEKPYTFPQSQGESGLLYRDRA